MPALGRRSARRDPGHGRQRGSGGRSPRPLRSLEARHRRRLRQPLPDPASPIDARRRRRSLTLPRMGETMEEGRVVAWLKQPGQTFARGDVIVEIETDKTTVEVPALDDGRLVDIVAQPGAYGGGRRADRPLCPGGADACRPGSRDNGRARRTRERHGSRLRSPIATDAGCRSPARAGTAFTGRNVDAGGFARRRWRAAWRGTAGSIFARLTGSGRRGSDRETGRRGCAGRTRLGARSRAPKVSTPGVLYLDLPEGRLAYRDWTPAEVARDGAVPARVRRRWRHVGGLRLRLEPRQGLPRRGTRPARARRDRHRRRGARRLGGRGPRPRRRRSGSMVSHLVGHSMGAAVAVRAAVEGLRPGPSVPAWRRRGSGARSTQGSSTAWPTFERRAPCPICCGVSLAASPRCRDRNSTAWRPSSPEGG